MKITPTPNDPLTSKAGAATNAPSARAVHQREGRSALSATSHPEVTLSPEASLLAYAEQRMANVPEIDWQRVEELRQAIQSGQFRVNPEKIAERLVSEVEHLLSQAQ